MGWPVNEWLKLVLISLCFASVSASKTASTASVLASQNYVRTLYGRSDLQAMLNEMNDVDLVLFFVNWCSHCQKYVPKLIAFAEDIQGWWPVLHIAAMDCYDNADVCSDYGVNAYPTLKLFWKAGRIVRNQEGDPIETSTGAELRKKIIDYIENRTNTGVTSRILPELNPSRAKHISDLWLSTSSDITKLLVVVEQHISYVGRELILDVCGISNVKGVRFIAGETPVELANVKATSLVLLERTHDLGVLSTANDPKQARRLFKEQLEEVGIYIHQPNFRLEQTAPIKPSVASVITITADEKKVYVDDIDTGLRYMLHSELALVDEFNSTQLDILRIFIGVKAVAMYVPLPSSMEIYLRHLSDLLVRSQAPLKAATFQWAVKNASVGFSWRNGDYLGCKGSEPHKRGYPCSLWLLFHLMTVGCYRKYLRGDELNPYEAIKVIRSYIVNFFTCKDCVGHFTKAAANLDEELDKPEKGVLWLWKTHNDVNLRLKGDASEDPEHPKQLFPTKNLCEDCLNATGEFKQWKVLDFLMQHYGPDNIYDGTLRQRAFDWVPISILLILLGVLVVIIVILCRIPRAEDIEKYVEDSDDLQRAATEATTRSSSNTDRIDKTAETTATTSAIN